MVCNVLCMQVLIQIFGIVWNSTQFGALNADALWEATLIERDLLTVLSLMRFDYINPSAIVKLDK